MALNWTEIKTKVDAGLEKAGADMVFTVTVPGSFDEVSGVATGDTTENYTVKAIQRTAGRFPFGTLFRLDAVIESDTISFLCGDPGVAIKPNWLATFGGETFTVVRAEPVAPAGTPVAWKIEVKR